MAMLVPAHGGGTTKPLRIPEVDRPEELKRAQSLKKVPMTSREVSDLIMLTIGAYTPLSGFMGEADWRSVCTDMKLTDGVFWPIPITLSAAQDLADSINLREDVALVDAESGEIMGIMRVSEKYTIDREFECSHVFRATDDQHPGVQKVLGQGEVNLAGPILSFSEGEYPEKYKGLYLRPAETRAIFAEKGWSKIAAFQTRNPMHRSHEHLAKIAIEVCDGVLIHQVLGKLKPGDIPAETRTEAINAMVDNYFQPSTVVQAGYPIEMRYAGPREALLHALIRQNFGCSHLIVGRDHAGVGDYYGPFDAQKIFSHLWEGALVTVPLNIDITFFCKKCDGMATARTCPHGKDDRVLISGTMQREMLGKGEDISPQFSRPEVVTILKKFYADQK
jgi:sulfate adenylyltransferase